MTTTRTEHLQEVFTQFSPMIASRVIIAQHQSAHHNISVQYRGVDTGRIQNAGQTSAVLCALTCVAVQGWRFSACVWVGIPPPRPRYNTAAWPPAFRRYPSTAALALPSSLTPASYWSVLHPYNFVTSRMFYKIEPNSM